MRTSMASSLAMGGPNSPAWPSARTDLRAPSLEPTLDEPQQLDSDHAHQGEQDDAKEQSVGLQGVARDSDHVAKPGVRRVQLADDYADQGPTNAQPQAGQER